MILEMLLCFFYSSQELLSNILFNPRDCLLGNIGEPSIIFDAGSFGLMLNRLGEPGSEISIS